MSDIAIFVGRQHHAQKLLNIGRFLALRGYNVYPITANNAINLDPPQENLGEYVHVYEYLTDEDVTKINEFVLKHPIGSYTTPEFWKGYSLREQMLVYHAFRNLLNSEDRPTAVLILHENNFWTKTLAYLCLTFNVPCFAFQEGLLRYKDQVDMRKQSSACEYSTKLFVWGDDSKRQYIEAGILEEEIVTAGATHLITQRKREEREQKRVTYFLPLLQHYVGNPEKDINQLSAICRKFGYTFVVRPHPFEKDIEIPFLMDKRDDIVDAIMDTDVAIVEHSTTALECLALGTPVIEFGEHMEPLHAENELIPYIKSVEDYDIIEAVMRVNYIPLIQEWIDWRITAGSLDLVAETIEAYL